MKVKNVNQSIVCRKADQSEVLIDFYRFEPVLDPTNGDLRDTKVQTVSRLVMTTDTAEMLMRTLTEMLKDKEV